MVFLYLLLLKSFLFAHFFKWCGFASSLGNDDLSVRGIRFHLSYQAVYIYLRHTEYLPLPVSEWCYLPSQVVFLCPLDYRVYFFHASVLVYFTLFTYSYFFPLETDRSLDKRASNLVVWASFSRLIVCNWIYIAGLISFSNLNFPTKGVYFNLVYCWEICSGNRKKNCGYFSASLTHRALLTPPLLYITIREAIRTDFPWLAHTGKTLW